MRDGCHDDDDDDDDGEYCVCQIYSILRKLESK